MKNTILVTIASFLLVPCTGGAQDASVAIAVDEGHYTISRHIYGHFSEHLGHCIYDGLYVGEDSPIANTGGVRNDVIEALKNIRIPNLRWPGGCFADEYHWMDGIGPKENRAEMVNTHWGGVTEDNSFGTHEFLNMCETLGAEPYICGNMGSGTVEEMSKWVEYMTFDGKSPMSKLRAENGRDEPWKVHFFGVGNESWGCGGHMLPEDYADDYRRYQTFCRNYGDNRLCKVASGANADDYNWTEVLMRKVPASMMWGLSLHYYTVPGTWRHKGSATQFTAAEYAQTMSKAYHIDELVTRHDSIMTVYDPQKKVALVVDEWGTWYDVEPGTNPGFLFQQNTMRDALVAAVTLNIFHKHCDRVRMANIAQLVNVLQAVILTDGDKMLLTPTYHVYDMYKVHQDATMLPVTVNAPLYKVDECEMEQLSASASRDNDGVIHVSLVNVSPDEGLTVSCNLRGASVTEVKGAQVLTSENVSDHNTFSEPHRVELASYGDYKLEDNVLTVDMPANAIVTVAVK